jgi:hypothetical protein
MLMMLIFINAKKNAALASKVTGLEVNADKCR